MVKQTSYRSYKEVEGNPPPMDESWWEAVLAEDDKRPGPNNHYPNQPSAQTFKQIPFQSASDSHTLDWILAKDTFESDKICEMEVTGYNRGGLLVCTEQLQGFVPVSHLIEITGEKDGEDYEQLLAAYVGRKLNLKIIECDAERGRVVLSERAALSSPGRRNQLLQQLKPGICVEGTVTNITDFGVFIDLGGVEGLVHVSEISWGRVRHPSDVVDYGERLNVHVISVDVDRSRVALSLKRLHANPWLTAEERYQPGQIAEATITSIVQFGAFARLEEGLDGLIHISEMCIDGEPVSDPAEVLTEGQKMLVRILQVDASKQRLGLSITLEP